MVQLEAYVLIKAWNLYTHNSRPEWWLHAFRLQGHPIDVLKEGVVEDGLFAALVRDAAQSPVDILGHELMFRVRQ